MQSGDKQKIRSRLRSYERKLQKEKREHGFYRDGAGKRYQIGPHYMLLGDNEGPSSGSRRNSLTMLASRVISCAGASRCTVRAMRSALPRSSARPY